MIVLIRVLEAIPKSALEPIATIALNNYDRFPRNHKAIEDRKCLLIDIAPNLIKILINSKYMYYLNAILKVSVFK